MYLNDAETAELASAYVTFEGEPRVVVWQIYIDSGRDNGPGGRQSFPFIESFEIGNTFIIKSHLCPFNQLE